MKRTLQTTPKSLRNQEHTTARSRAGRRSRGSAASRGRASLTERSQASFTPLAKGRASEAEVVLMDDLRPHLQQALEEHKANHPAKPWNNYNNGPDIYRGTMWLADELGCTERNIFRIMNEAKWVGLDVADRLLIACNKSHLLGNVIPIVPNPAWNIETRQAYTDQPAWPPS